MKIVLLLLAAAAAQMYFIGCNDNPQDALLIPDPKGMYKVSGYISFNGTPLEGADIIVTGAVNWRTKSRSDGKFILEGLTKGEHRLRIEKVFEDSCFIYQQMNVIVVNDITETGEIKLPAPVHLYELDSSKAGDSIVKLKWSRSADADFTGYKVYRATTPFINDTNGELVYSTIYDADTIFTEEGVRTGLRHYYRVYSYYEDQRGAATNHKYVDIPEYNLILNSGFEKSTDGQLPDQFKELIAGKPGFKYFSINSDVVHSGVNSLRIYYNDSLANPLEGHSAWGGLMQKIYKTNLIVGREYTLTFWSKSVKGSFQVRLVRESNLDDYAASYIVSNTSEWSEKELTFTVDQSGYYELWISVRPGFAVNAEVEGYIDDLKILR